MNEHVRRYPTVRAALYASRRNLMDWGWKPVLFVGLFGLVSGAVAEPDDRPYRRLVVLLGLVAVLLALGCALGIVWRWELPHTPVVRIPVIVL